MRQLTIWKGAEFYEDVYENYLVSSAQHTVREYLEKVKVSPDQLNQLIM